MNIRGYKEKICKLRSPISFLQNDDWGLKVIYSRYQVPKKEMFICEIKLYLHYGMWRKFH